MTSELLTMGGYAAYVWPSYGLTALVMVGLMIASRRALKARERELRILQETLPGGRRRAAVKTEA